MRYRSAEAMSWVSFNIELPEGYSFPVCGTVNGYDTGKINYLLDLFAEEWEPFFAQRREKCHVLFTYLCHELYEAANLKKNAHVDNIRRYISRNLCSQITLNSLSEQFLLTPQYICQLFKQSLGMTVVEYINAERIAVAKNRIINEKTPLGEIAESMGFANYNYFSSVFKRQTGLSPTEYRKKFGKSVTKDPSQPLFLVSPVPKNIK